LVIEGKIYLLIGADLIKDIHTWMSYKELIEKVNLVVISRDNFIADSYKEDFPYIMPFNSTRFNVSSSLVRQRLLEGHSIKYLVPKSVEDYIDNNGLYKKL
jgi:nicotinate-nucleotide adenylyltransferase